MKGFRKTPRVVGSYIDKKLRKGILEVSFYLFRNLFQVIYHQAGLGLGGGYKYKKWSLKPVFNVFLSFRVVTRLTTHAYCSMPKPPFLFVLKER